MSLQACTKSLEAAAEPLKSLDKALALYII